MRASLGKLALVLFGLLLPFFLLEIAVRALPVELLPAHLAALLEEMDEGSRRQYREDSELRHTFKPGTDMTFKHPEYTYRIKTHLNFPDAGFRGGTLGGPTWGVALGDSFTFGAGVDQEATWVARLSDLAKRDVVNLGVPAFGSSQYTRTLQKYGIPLKPEIVFYTIFPNDLGDCLRFERWLNGYRKRTSFKRYMRSHSVTYNLFSKLSGLWKSRSRHVEVPNIGIKLVPRKLRDPFRIGEKKYDSAWALASRQIEKAHQASKAVDAAFVLLYFPSKEEVYWDLVKAKAERFEAFEEKRDKLRISAAEFCKARRIDCFDLTPALRARALNGEKLYFSVDIHWNESGNRVVAEEIYKFLRDKKLI